MKRLFTTVIITCMMLLMVGCGSGPVGYWQIEQVTAGELVMTQEDASSFGMATVGAIKLQKSGACVVKLLGDEFEGTWEEDSDGTITVTYGDDNLVLTGSIDEEGVMTLTDDQGQEYLLKK